MKITIDRQRCIGAGQCVLASDTVFDQDREDGLVRLLIAEVPAHLEAEVREAELICPSGAIDLIDD